MPSMVTPEVVPEGNAISVSIQWINFAGGFEEPSSVTYRVYDFLTRNPVSDATDVPVIGYDMSFIIPAGDLPASTTSDFRRLVIQVTGTFESFLDEHTEKIHVSVERKY
jgi:hypothetical protein